MLNFEIEQAQLLKEVARYLQLFKGNNDDEQEKKAELFAKKIIDEEYMIGYAGHFSAGKSSMINALTGGDLLPSSPIPTSANIVKVKKTESDYCIIHSVDGSAVKYGGKGLSEAVKSFSIDGSAVSLVEIGHKESTLPEGITVMDTPGVDSTDDAHRLSTESALHLADLVFYTMDYNHVQSELNFRFTKELLRYNSNVYLIINQIDKHRESELPFSKFTQSVEDSFKMWGVEPKGIFYTSLKDLELPNNDFYKIKSIVDESMENWQDQFIENAYRTLEKLKDEHIQFLNDEISDRKNTYSEIVSEDEWNELEELTLETKEAKQMAELLSGDTFSSTFEKDRSSLLSNAAITPYETRDLLKEYLESLSSSFKVGFLFGAKKTLEEKEKRKLLFFDNISKLIHAQIEVHLKTLMKKSLKNVGILTDELSLSIDNIEMTIPLDVLEKEFSSVDVLTGDAVLNYADRIKSAVQTYFRLLTEDWKHEMSQLAATAGNENAGSIEQKVFMLEKKLHAITQVDILNTQLITFKANSENMTLALSEETEALIKSWQQKETLIISEYETEVKSSDIEIIEEDIQIEIENASETNYEKVVEDAKRVAQIIKDVPGFNSTVDYLMKKADRLEGQEFTVALFGAFSAGKSSFSNALIGEQILPVSPNPTTATINRIRPVIEGKDNCTADIFLKTVDRMTEDVLRSFEKLGIEVNTLDRAFSKADEAISVELSNESHHIHKAFIAAFKIGYPVYKEMLGTVLTVEREEFVKFVAEEDRSCFVESIDFYYDCELTRKGITLVDTPGADSINARHTDVAFDYIRNADAILFVTYYNHAFARADREFLVQLGRVKDAFELDKMFFIVNAIDLATDIEEANTVKSFVAGELQKFGIRNPRVHGISSIEALAAKKENSVDPFMMPFESEFHYFLEHDLKGLAIQALVEETEKTTERLASLISRTNSNLLRKSERLGELNHLEGDVRHRYADSFSEVLTRSTINELSELVYYILQRVFLRFGDFFKESYNPSVFSKNSANQALKNSLEETLQMVGFDLTQELKVTNLRILNFMTKQLKERERLELNELKEMDSTFSLSPYDAMETELLTFDAPFTDSSIYSSVNRVFKNQKSFFEKGDRDILRDKLEVLLKKDTALYLGEEKEVLEKWTNQWIESEAEGLRQHLLKECLNQIASERTLLNQTETIHEWEKVYEKLQKEGLV
ncbi:dynamin family protein [Sporosarcina siberiensis]|uniref:Dynamin family protein n=1 Tax=Sporosarcina siberiensis TaxID=1365606 RepID=A0ABW4SHY8_9BACL